MSLPALLWSIHNGHRIVIPHLFHFADLGLFHGTNRFLLTAIFLAQGFNVLVLDRLTTDVGGFRGPQRRLALGFALFFLFCPVQRENFMCGWEIAYILPFVLATLACSALALHAGRNGSRSGQEWLLVSLAAAVLATYSLASGVFIWPTLIVEALILRLPMQVMRRLAILSILFLALKVVDVNPESSRLLASSSGHVLDALHFFNALIGRLWLDFGRSASSYSAAGALVPVIALAVLLIRPARPWPLSVAMLSIGVFAVVHTVLTALARWNSGAAGRYQTPILLLWCAGSLILLQWSAARWQIAGQIVCGLLFLLALGLSLRNVPRIRSEARAIGARYRLAQASMSAGVLSPDAYSILGMPLEWTYGELAFLAKAQDSIFRARPTSLIGRPLTAFFQRKASCGGAMTGMTWVADEVWPGIELNGWMPNKDNRAATSWLVVTDTRGRIVGFGSDSGQVPASDGWRELNLESVPWKAFVAASALNSELLIYRVVDQQSVCPIGPWHPIVPVKGPPVFEDNKISDLTEVWRPSAGAPHVEGGTISLSERSLAVRSLTLDTQLLFTFPVDLKQFETLVIKARFMRHDSIELFFGQQINGRGLLGFVPYPNRWVYALAQVGRNPFWKQEAGTMLRFDPTGGAGAGSLTEIAAIWGSRKAIGNGPDEFQFALAESQEP